MYMSSNAVLILISGHQKGIADTGVENCCSPWYSCVPNQETCVAISLITLIQTRGPAVAEGPRDAGVPV